MRKFHSVTLVELVSEISSYAHEDDRIVGLSNYGDRLGTMQAIPITGIEVVSVSESAYSDSGFKIVDVNKGDIQVITLNPDMDMDMDSALTAEELLNLIKDTASEEMLEMKVTFGSDYGDRVNTTQANSLTMSDAGQCQLCESAYSDSGYAACSDEDDEEGESGFFCIG